VPENQRLSYCVLPKRVIRKSISPQHIKNAESGKQNYAGGRGVKKPGIVGPSTPGYGQITPGRHRQKQDSGNT